MNKYVCVYIGAALDGDSQYLPFAPDGIPFVVADSMWKADMQGNHRAVVEVSGIKEQKAVQVYLPWRRPDLRPETKKVVVVDAQSGSEVNIGKDGMMHVMVNRGTIICLRFMKRMKLGNQV